MAIDPKVIDKLLAEYEKPEDIIGENGLLKQLTKALVERALQAELTTHLGYEKHSRRAQQRQQPQRRKPKALARRLRHPGDRGAARPGGEPASVLLERIRAEACRQQQRTKAKAQFQSAPAWAQEDQNDETTGKESETQGEDTESAEVFSIHHRVRAPRRSPGD